MAFLPELPFFKPEVPTPDTLMEPHDHTRQLVHIRTPSFLLVSLRGGLVGEANTWNRPLGLSFHYNIGERLRKRRGCDNFQNAPLLHALAPDPTNLSMALLGEPLPRGVWQPGRIRQCAPCHAGRVDHHGGHLKGGRWSSGRELVVVATAGSLLSLEDTADRRVLRGGHFALLCVWLGLLIEFSGADAGSYKCLSASLLALGAPFHYLESQETDGRVTAYHP